MVRKVEIAKEELAKRIADEHEALIKDIVKANKNLAARAMRLGLTFDLDAEADILTISIGDGGRDTYTQGLDHVYADMDIETNHIVKFTIMQLTSFLKTPEGRHVFSDEIILPVLHRYGVMNFPPKREGTLVAAEELKTLVPA